MLPSYYYDESTQVKHKYHLFALYPEPNLPKQLRTMDEHSFASRVNLAVIT